MADLADLGFKVDTSGLASGERALDGMTKSGKKTEQQVDKTASAVSDFIKQQKELSRTVNSSGQVLNKNGKVLIGQTEKLNKLTDAMKRAKQVNSEAGAAAGKMGKKVGQASIQVEQLIGSISGGQDPLKAFAFQAADLGIVLGSPLVGAIVGVSASLTSLFIPAVLEALMGTKEFSADIEGLKDNLEDLEKLGKSRLIAVQQAATDESNKKLKESIALSKEIAELEARRKALADATKPKLDVNKVTFSPLAGAASGSSQLGLNKAQLAEVNKELKARRATLEEVNEEMSKQNALALTAGDQLKNIINNGKTLSEEEKKSLASKNKSIQSITASLELQAIAMTQGADAAQEFAIRQQLGLKATEALPAAIQAQIDTISDANTELEIMEQLAEDEALLNSFKGQKKEASSLSGEIANIGSAWQGTAGDTISAIGKMMGAADQYQSKMDQVAKSGGGMGGLLPTIGLAVTAFSLFDSIFGGSESAGPSIKEIQEMQSVGTLKGFSDEASLSIVTGFEAFADIQKDQLSELVELNRSFHGLSLAIAGAGGASIGGLIPSDELFTSGGGIFTTGLTIAEQAYSELSNGISATIPKIVQSGHLIQTGEVDIEDTPQLQDRLTSIFTGIGDAVVESAALLTGSDVADKVGETVIDALTVSLVGMNADERQEALSEAFSAQADKLSENIFSDEFFMQWQKDGEGAFETLTRLATEQASYNDSIQMIGSSLDDVFSIDQAQNVLAYAGGFGEFSSMAKDFFNDFLTTTEQLEFQGNKLNDTLTELGFNNLPMNNDSFKELVNSIDRTTDEGQKLYVELLQLAPAFADFTDKTKMLNNERLMLEADLLDAQGKAVDALAIRRNMELEAMDSSLHSLQQQVWAEQERKKAIDDSNASLRSVISNIRGSLGTDKVALSDALAAAKSGNFDLAQRLNVGALTSLSDVGFKSAQAMQIQQATNRAQLEQIANLAEGRLTDTEKQTNLLSDINDGIGELVQVSHPSTAGGFVGNSQANQDDKAEMMEMIEKLVSAAISTAKHASETASNTKKIYYDGVDINNTVKVDQV